MCVAGFFQGERKLCVVMELCDLGTLRTYIQEQEGPGLKEEAFIDVTKQMCKGLQGCAHTDSSLTNLNSLYFLLVA